MAAQLYTIKEAKEQVKRSRKTGWPLANMQRQPNDLYIISTHDKKCRCGGCPIIHKDGYVF